MPVDYRESEWRSKFNEWLAAFVAAMSSAADVEKNWRLAMGALEVSAAAWALASKRSKWEREQEVRMIVLVRESVKVVPAEEIRADGKVKRFITVPVTRLRRMPVEEIIVGPNQDAAVGRLRAVSILKAAGYRNPEFRVVLSAAEVPREVVPF